MKLIVGSTALSYHGYSLKPSDIDIWTDEPFTKEKGYDYKSIPTHILKLIPHPDGYATPDAIYTIKCSH